MLKSRILPFLLLGSVGSAMAQLPSPVKWTFTVQQENGETELVFKATIKEGFHVYSQDISPDAGPIPTSFTFEPAKTYELSGKVTEGKAIEVFDQNFGVNLKYFSGETVFRQKVKVKGTAPVVITGIVTFMVCD